MVALNAGGTVAATGDRMPPIHWGRIGDPLKPSIYDFYAVTKIAGERAVLESLQHLRRFAHAQNRHRYERDLFVGRHRTGSPLPGRIW